MYQIGMFSKINRVTTKTLRHYDETGLLKPSYVDDETGYRYYTNDQLPRLHQIMALKQMGLGLSDIKKVIKNPESLDAFLQLKVKEIESNIQMERQKLSRIISFINNIRGKVDMTYNPIIKNLTGGWVAYSRRVLSSYDEYFDFMPKMSEELARQKAVCAKPEYCFTIYHDGEYKEKDIDVEICELMESPREDSDLIKYKKIEEVPRAVCVLHKGPYSSLAGAYNFIFGWIRQNDYSISDNPRESYIDGIWNKDDENDWLTEIQVPVE